MAVHASSSYWKCTQEVPVVGETVYYFPVGHSQHQAITMPNVLYRSSMPVPCAVSAVDLLTDKFSNEVYAKIRLIPFPMGVPFEVVVYYPGPGRSIFVVGWNKVEAAAAAFPWKEGMRVRTPLDVEGTKWVHGRRHAPYWWEMLWVLWEEPGGKPSLVSPWEVEYVPEIIKGAREIGVGGITTIANSITSNMNFQSQRSRLLQQECREPSQARRIN